MPRSSGSDIPQRHSRRVPHPQRTSSCDSDPLHHRPVTETSRRLGERRSTRGPQPDSLNQKKLGTRISDLESQLIQAQGELKNLKEQLASAVAAQKEAQQELESKNMKPTVLLVPKEENVEEADECVTPANADDNRQEADVFEVPVEMKVVKPISDSLIIDQVEKESKSIDMSAQPQEISEPEKSPSSALTLKDDEINMLKAKLEEKTTESEAFSKENEDLKNQLQEAITNISSAKPKEENISLRLTQLEEEVKVRKENEAKLREKLEATEGDSEQLKAEMKKMRVQTEQWRKAADAAAAVLAGNVEMNERISGRCGSMDKQFTGGYPVFVGSPGMADELDDGLVSSGRRKGSGIKVFGDLWKKKSHNK